MNLRCRSSRRCLLLGGLLLAVVQSGCQWVFGDFEMADPAETGGTTGQGGTTSTSSTTVTSCGQGRSFYCDLNVLINCSTGKQTTCARQSLCDGEYGVCLVCSDGEKQCNGAVVEKCNAAQSGWNAETDCGLSASAKVCEPNLKTCVTCLDGDAKCAGTVILKCNADRSGWDETPCDITYDPKGCVVDSATRAHCVACDSDSFVASCSGDNLFTCVNGQIVRTACANGCAARTSSTPASCI